MTKNDIDGRIAQANGRLKSAKVGIAISRQGDCLYLRGIFPPKPESERKTAYQQRLVLDIHANPLGIKNAEAEARKIGVLLDFKEFNWLPYLKDLAPSVTSGEWVAKFEKDYFDKRDRTPKTETTWQKNYNEFLKRLPVDEPLSIKVLKNLIDQIAPDTCSRQNYAISTTLISKIPRNSDRNINPKKRFPQLSSCKFLVIAITVLLMRNAIRV